MIEWSWRIESEDAIVCGSWSDEGAWEQIFQSLIGREVQDVSLYGRIPELSIALAGWFYVASFMTAEGQPEWTLFDHFSEQQKFGWIEVCDGKVCEILETRSAPAIIDPDSKIA